MASRDQTRSVDRRLFLGASALTLASAVGPARAQDARTAKPPAEGRRLTQTTADFISRLELTAVPQPVIDRARDVFIDTVGVMLAGSHEEVSHLVYDMVKAEGSAPASTVVGQSLRASPQLAALANGVAGHAMDYDFTYMRAQSIAALIPAILPVAETTGATPAQAIEAFIVGAEIAARLVRSNQDGPMFDGWHTTGMVGAIAAAAACAKLLKVPIEAIPNVLGISTSLASGITGNFGTMTKPLHCGNAARNGVMAAVLGSRGFTASATAFEGRAGYFNTFGRGLDVTLEPFKDLGQRYDLVSGRYRFKPYPCGGLTHTSIEAALDLRNQIGARTSDIQNIHCYVTRSAGQRAGTEYPATVESAKFSVGYLVPYALIHGAPRIAAFTEQALQDERVRALAKTVTASVDPELGPGGDDSPARIKITMSNGQVLEQRKDFGSGSNRNPMSSAQIEGKFFDCAAQVMTAERAKKILSFLNTLPEQRSFKEFWPLLQKES